MRTYVYSADQDPVVDVPAHFASHNLAVLVVGAALAVTLDARHRRIQLLPDQNWQIVKARFKRRESDVPLYDPNKLRGGWVETYPPVARDVNERERQLQLWARATRF